MSVQSVPADAPVTASNPVVRHHVGLPVQSCVYAGALLRTWLRDPGVLVQAIVFPAFLLAMFHLVLGKSTTDIGLGDSIFATAGLVALVSAMFGTIMTGIHLIDERDSGVLARLWTLPVNRSGYLVGRILAEVIRIVVGTVVLFIVAIPMGFRFDQGWLAGLGAVLVPVLGGIGVVFIVIACATVVQRSQLQELSILFLLMMFFNTGFAPIGEYPGWLQPIVRYQPMSPAIDAMNGLTEGGAVMAPLLATIAWAIGLSLVFGTLAVRGYRRATQRSI